MKFLYVVGDPHFRLSDTAGYSRHIMQCTESLTNIGHEVHLIAASRDSAGKAYGPMTGNAKRWVPDWAKCYVKDIAKLICDSSLARRIRAHVKELKPDVIYDRSALFHQSAVSVGKDLGIPVVLEVNARLVNETSAYFGLGLRSVAEKIENRVYTDASAIVVVSNQLKQELINCGVPGEKVFVNPNGVNPDEFHPSISSDHILAKHNLAGKRVIGFVGSLAPWHGVQGLIKSAKIVCDSRPNVRFLIVGSGHDFDALKKQAADYGIADKVVFTGSVSPAEVPAYVNAMHIATAPYPADDEFYFSPIKLFEYMAAARAVVASNLGQIGEVIRDGENGRLVTAGSHDELAESIIHLVDNPALCEDLGANARETVLAHYTWDQNAARLADLCSHLVLH